MRPRRSVPLMLSCAAVVLAGCGGSSLLDGSSASELQESLGRVRTAIDEGRCDEARSAARAGSERVDALPSDVDAELRDTLKRGFDELSSSVETDCEPKTPTTTNTVPTETPATPAPVEPTSPPEPAPTTEPTTDEEPATPTEPEDEPLEPDPGEPTSPDDDGDDDSGGVAPGVDGPGASERSAQRGKDRTKELRKRTKDAAKGRDDG